MTTTQKPSEEILEIINALKVLDGKQKQDNFSTYEAQAICLYLDKLIEFIPLTAQRI